MKKKMQLIEVNKNSDKVSSVFVLIFISGTPRPTKMSMQFPSFLEHESLPKDHISFYFQRTVLLNGHLLSLRTHAI